MLRPIARILRAAVFGFRDLTSRIRSPLFWRAFYAVLGSRFAVSALALGCRVVARVSRRLEPEEVVVQLSHLFLNGWPHHTGTPWVNLDVSRAYWRVVRQLRGSTPSPQRARRAHPDPLRVGVLANLAGSLIFPRSLFVEAPAGIELAAFDLSASEQLSAIYLQPLVASYRRIDPAATHAIGAAIEEADLDLLLVDVYKSDVYGILDGVSTPCIANLSTTVNLRFQESVSFHLYFLQQADYLIEHDRIFRCTSRSWFSDQIVFPGFQPFDIRGLDPQARRRWAERKPLLVYHGKLYKLSRPYLDCVFGLLRDDPELELVAMGRDTDGALDRIRAAASAHGVERRVHYEGEFRPIRNADGELDHPSWLHLVGHLAEARLAPDPWPLAGGCSRVEAYAAGVPVVHMGIRTDPGSWGRQQHTVTADQPALTVPSGTGYSIEAYRELCRCALYDEEFADALADEQARLAVQLSDPAAFWRQLFDCYERWAGGRAEVRVSSSVPG